MDKIIEAAKRTDADAVHPGYSFLAENAGFASRCEQEGIKFIGPSIRCLALTGDKVAARREMMKAGMAAVPGADQRVTGLSEAKEIAREIGYPVVINPFGGGGIGMAVVENERDLAPALESTQAAVAETEGHRGVCIEKYLTNPRHIEFQLLADSYGNVIHLGERECSIRRRHQKLIEESPSPAVSRKLRKEMGEKVMNAARMIDYEGAGTMEFLFSDGRFYFLKMNVRFQVGHPVTEMVTGVDIVKEGIRIASGLPLSFKQKDVRMKGSAIECRINAEDPLNDFVPTPGKIISYYAPGGAGIRVDSAAYASYMMPPFYDPMISKLTAWGKDRSEAIGRMRRALYEYIITGTTNNLLFHKAAMENNRFLKADLVTHFMDRENKTLLDFMTAIMAREMPIEERLAYVYQD
jgi:pyruvate carboxylase subunit A